MLNIKKPDQYLILNRDDIARYLSEEDISALNNMIYKIQALRDANGRKKDVEYWVINKEHPLSPEIVKMMQSKESEWSD